MTQLELRSWFLEPIPRNSNRWSSIRIWGLPLSPKSRKWWRSSSIRTRHCANQLSTRYGTSVRLHGPICKRYALALRMPEHVIHAFAHGFPAEWEQILVNRGDGLRRSRRIAFSSENQLETAEAKPKAVEKTVSKRRENPPRNAPTKQMPKRPLRSSSAVRKSTDQKSDTGSTRQTRSVAKRTRATKSSLSAKGKDPVRKPVKALKKPTKSALKRSTRPSKSSETAKQKNKSTRKRVAFADVKQSKPSVPERPSIKPIAVPKSPTADWSKSQKEAFERQWNIVPADDIAYWTEIAAGVEGKTADDCQALWESSWSSPPKAKTKKVDWGKPQKSPKVSTPEVVMHLRKAATRKRSRNTGKYRSGVRRLADTIARDTNDDLLEPEIVTPELSGISLRDGFGMPPGLGMDGTPGTEVRMRRKQADEDGELATPEILARGKEFGLQEADKYVSLFKRRLGTCVVPDMKKDTAKAKKVFKEARITNLNFIQTTLPSFDITEDDAKSHDSEESDLFF